MILVWKNTWVLTVKEEKDVEVIVVNQKPIELKVVDQALQDVM
jgi:hypothetical protein